MPLTRVFPLTQGAIQAYIGSMNVDTSWGKAVPSFDHADMTSSAQKYAWFLNEVIETTAPSGAPRQYAFANKSCYRFDNGTLTTDTTFNSAPKGAAIVDNGSGTKILVVGFGSATDPRCAIRDLSTDTTPWTLQTTATYVQFSKMVQAGPDIYMISNTGVYVLGEYHITKIPAGSDPTLVASCGGGVPCGHSDWAANDLAPYGNTVLVSKPDGLYYWDDQGKIFRNAMDRLKLMPHSWNGSGMEAGENGVWYPTADGRLFFWDGYDITEQTPWKDAELPRDGRIGRITAVADRGDSVAVVTTPWHVRVDGPRASAACGLKVIKVDGGTATDLTTDVTDGSLATPAAANMNAWGNGGGDYLYFGSDVPPEGYILRVTRNPNTAAQYFATPEYSNGAGGWVSFTAIIDSSILEDSGKSLRVTSYPKGESHSILSWTDINGFDLIKKDDVAFGGGVGTITNKYWVRFGDGSTTGMTATTTIDQVELVPARAGVPIAANDYTHRDRAGGLVHIYIGRRRGGKILWHDVYTIDSPEGVTALSWTTGKCGAMTNGGPALLVWGRDSQHIIGEGITRDPSRTSYPRLTQYTATEPGPLLALRNISLTYSEEGETYTADPRRKKRINKVLIEGNFIQPADEVRLYVQWDEGRAAWKAAEGGSNPIVFDEGGLRGGPWMGEGRELSLWVGIDDSSQNDPAAPEITDIFIDWDYAGEAYDLPTDLAFQTPEVT